MTTMKTYKQSSPAVSLRKLSHHLRTYRKTARLSQHELAYLLGGGSGTKVSRYEHFQRVPSLATIVAYEIIFKESLHSLLPGLYDEVQERIRTRAQQLLARVSARKEPGRDAKLALLRSLIHRSER